MSIKTLHVSDSLHLRFSSQLFVSSDFGIFSFSTVITLCLTVLSVETTFGGQTRIILHEQITESTIINKHSYFVRFVRCSKQKCFQALQSLCPSDIDTQVSYLKSVVSVAIYKL